ncbi:multidrug resistance efflux transporter family protein [bacterium]|nr:multidrug resistance efflux transporter family protein [bacterium]
MRAISLGVGASFFFASTFILNRLMQLNGGDWGWSGSLRIFWTVPILLALVAWQGKLVPVLRELARHPMQWLGWSTVGFGLCFAPLCYAAASGPSWLVAGTWQLTILAGMILAPFLREPGEHPAPIPLRTWFFSGLILLGVVLLQGNEARHLTAQDLAGGVLPVVIAAFAFPLGNRRMMRFCQSRLDAVQRTLAMTLASLPFWIALALWRASSGRLPTSDQLFQSALVAICSGVIATIFFFAATNAVQDSPAKLAAVEATQAGEVVFATLGEGLILSKPLPAGGALGGLALIVVGMLLHALGTRRPQEAPMVTPSCATKKEGGEPEAHRLPDARLT